MIKNGFLLNAISLYGVAFINLLIPLVFVPYFSSNIGLSNFGFFTLCYSVVSYVGLLVECGFNTPLVKYISNNADRELNSSLVSSAFCFRLVLFSFSLPIIFFVYGMYIHRSFFYLIFCFFGILSYAINPISIYQANNKLPLYSITNAIVRLSSASVGFLYLYLFPKSMWVVFFVFFVSQFISYLLLVIFAVWTKQYSFVAPSRSIYLTSLFKDSLPFLFGGLFSSAYTLIVPSVISAVFGMHLLGMYGLIDRILQPLKTAIMPLINILYPAVCKEMISSQIMAYKKSLKYIFWLIVVVLLFYVFVFIMKNYIYELVFKGAVPGLILELVFLDLFFVYLYQMFLYLFVVPFGFSKVLNFVYAASFSLVVVFVFVATKTNSINYIYIGVVVADLLSLIFLVSIFFRFSLNVRMLSGK